MKQEDYDNDTLYQILSTNECMDIYGGAFLEEPVIGLFASVYVFTEYAENLFK